MAVKNRKCTCCGTSYKYCPDCSKADALKESWHAEFCSSECKDLWLTLTRYSMDRLSKSEAKAIISELELKPIESYVACVQRDYEKVMQEEKKVRKTQKKVEPVIQTVLIQEPEVALVEPEVVQEEVEAEQQETVHEVVTIENE